jgi:hypothetical protein
MKAVLFLSTAAAAAIAISPSFAQKIGAGYPQAFGTALMNAQVPPPPEPAYQHGPRRVPRNAQRHTHALPAKPFSAQ